MSLRVQFWLLLLSAVVLVGVKALRRLPLRCATATSGVGSNDGYSELQDEIMKRVMTVVPSLRERPGFAFSLGCNSWNSAGYSGKFQGWTGSHVRWISSSRMVRSLSSSSEQPEASSPPSSSVGELLDLSVFVGASLDVPHMRLSLERDASSGTSHLFMDYVPREELLVSLDHFDRYFSVIDPEVAALLQPLLQNGSCNSARLGAGTNIEVGGVGSAVNLGARAVSSLLSRMTASPFAVNVLVPAELENTVLPALCYSHVDRWCRWMQQLEEQKVQQKMASAEGEAEHNVDVKDAATMMTALQRNVRDTSVARVMFEEYKIRFARVLGEDFAPKAEPIAEACMGPRE